MAPRSLTIKASDTSLLTSYETAASYMSSANSRAEGDGGTQFILVAAPVERQIWPGWQHKGGKFPSEVFDLSGAQLLLTDGAVCKAGDLGAAEFLASMVLENAELVMSSDEDMTNSAMSVMARKS